MADINAVSLKLPPFWPAQAEVWFLQVEAQFATRGIANDATKYYYVVSALDQATAGRLVDVLTNPPDTDLYASIKARLITTFGLSRRERAARLLRMPGLGDRKPSQLMDDMLALAGDHQPCFLFEQLFLEQLPDDVRLQLANADFGDARKVALLADGFWSAREQQVVPINKVVAAPPKSGRTSQRSNRNVDGVCFYHARFGPKAHRCVSPCSYSGNSQAGRQ